MKKRGLEEETLVIDIPTTPLQEFAFNKYSQEHPRLTKAYFLAYRTKQKISDFIKKYI